MLLKFDSAKLVGDRPESLASPFSGTLENGNYNCQTVRRPHLKA